WDAPSILQSDNSKKFTADKDNLTKFVFSYNTTSYSFYGKTSHEVMFGYKLYGVYQQFNPADFQEIEVDEIQTIPQTKKNHLEKNLYETSQPVAIAPDTDMNSSTRKRKLHTTFNETRTVISMTNNNKTIIVEIPIRSTVRYSVKRIYQIKNKNKKAMLPLVAPLAISLPSATSSSLL
ncbi:3391_t:CDS:2, partial [Scutellospora calospora]